MAPAYKLTYFDMRGVIEPVRFLLKYGGIDFEDDRIKQEDWPKLREKTAFGQLPILEHKGKSVNQSIAVCRYFGKLVKLAGKDAWEDLEIDAVVDTLNDLLQKILPVIRESDEAKKKTMKDTAVNETLPYYFSRLEEMAKKNNGHLAVPNLNWADVFFAAMAPTYDNFVGTPVFDKYPNLKALIAKVEGLPAIKKWIEVRPKTQY